MEEEGGGSTGDESVEVNEYVQYSTLWHAASPVIVIRYPLLLGGNECLEAGGNPKAQLVEKRRL